MFEILRLKVRRFLNKNKERKQRNAWDSHDLNGLEENSPWWMDDREVEYYKYMAFCRWQNIELNYKNLELYKNLHPDHFEKLKQYLSDEVIKNIDKEYLL